MSDLTREREIVPMASARNRSILCPCADAPAIVLNSPDSGTLSPMAASDMARANSAKRRRWEIPDASAENPDHRHGRGDRAGHDGLDRGDRAPAHCAGR